MIYVMVNLQSELLSSYKAFISELSGNMFIVIVCVPACDVIHFEIFFSFLITPFSYITKKVKTKKALFIIFKDFPLKQIKPNFFERWEFDFKESTRIIFFENVACVLYIVVKM